MSSKKKSSAYEMRCDQCQEMWLYYDRKPPKRSDGTWKCDPCSGANLCCSKCERWFWGNVPKRPDGSWICDHCIREYNLQQDRKQDRKLECMDCHKLVSGDDIKKGHFGWTGTFQCGLCLWGPEERTCIKCHNKRPTYGVWFGTAGLRDEDKHWQCKECYVQTEQGQAWMAKNPLCVKDVFRSMYPTT